MSAEAASGPGTGSGDLPEDPGRGQPVTSGDESVAENLRRLETALKRLSWLATMRLAPTPAPAPAPAREPRGAAETGGGGQKKPDSAEALYEALTAVTAERDRLVATLAALQEDHDRLKAEHVALGRQREDLSERLDTAIGRLRGLVAGEE